MTKELSVDEQTLQRKTRHRLMGAAAFTLLMVVTLPMVLDSEPRSTSQNISLDIPPPENQPAPAAPSPASMPTAAEAPAPVVEAPVVEPEKHSVVEAPPAPTENVAPVVTKAAPQKPLVVIPAMNGDRGEVHYMLQVGKFSNPKMADHVAEKLRANYLKVNTEQSGSYTRIQIGPFPDKAQAEKARQLLLKQGTRTSLIPIK